jgi:1-acyl-sn-glycerol-3-phosphate acyltransferase
MNSMDIYSITAKLILRIYQRVLWQNPHVCGDLPQCSGAKIIAANHPNATDAFHFPFVFPGKLHFLIQGDLFLIPFFGWLLARCEQVPVWPDKKLAAVKQARALLAKGKTVVIFPEGRLNPGYQPLKAFTGAVWLSLTTGAPIIPVGIYVPARHLRYLTIQRDGRLRQGQWQTGGKCYLHIGAPWYPGEEKSRTGSACTAQELTTRLMEKIAGLVSQVILESDHEENLLSHPVFRPHRF